MEIKFLPSGRPHAKKCNSHNVNCGTFNKTRECLIINETTETFFIYTYLITKQYIFLTNLKT